MERLVKDAPDDEKEKLVKNNLIRFYDGKKTEEDECAYFPKQENSRGRGKKRGSQRGRDSSNSAGRSETAPPRNCYNCGKSDHLIK